MSATLMTGTNSDMNLNNPFPMYVRLLYLGWWKCFLCGGNGSDCGGLEIHHVLGRISDVAFNSSCLCKKCHATVGHTQEEHRLIFGKFLEFAHAIRYSPNEEDLLFLEKNYYELVSCETEKMLQRL